MKKYSFAFILLLVLCCILSGCAEERNNDSELPQAIKELNRPDRLNVFIAADAVHEYYQSEEQENVYFTTMLSVGDFDATTTTYGEQGFLFFDAIKRYERETGVELSIKWYEHTSFMEEELEKMSDEELPDLIITSNTTEKDYYRYMEEELFYDLTSIFEQCEMYSNGAYNEQVLHAGEYDQKQYIVPILFNVDTIMGSQEMWEDLNFHAADLQDHSELLDALVYIQGEDIVDQVAVQFVSQAGLYLPQAIYEASGEKWIDYSKQAATLDENSFRKMCIFYDQFLEEQFDKEFEEGERINWASSKHIDVCMSIKNALQIDEFMDDIGCFVEGGNSGQAALHSAAAQAWYYGSRYNDLGQGFEVYAMPGKNGGSTAHVTYFGAVLKSTKHPEASFEFLKYLMDSEVSPLFGLSVNQANLQNQLEFLTENAYYIRPGLQIRVEGSPMDTAADYMIKTMPMETKEKLAEIIANVENVSLPNWPVYEILQTQMQSYAKGECTLEEAYQYAVDGLSEYAKGR